MNTFKKNILGVVLSLFMMVGIASNGAATEITLPDPTVTYQVDSGTRYLAWAHDDFWSYSADLLVQAQASGSIPATYGNYKDVFGGVGSGTLDVRMFSGSNKTNSDYNMQDPTLTPGGNNSKTATWVGSWGKGIEAGNPVTVAGPVTVNQVLTYLHSLDSNNNIPVFMLDLNQTTTNPDLGFVGHVYLATSATSGPVTNLITGQIMEWSFDDLPQPAETVDPGRGTWNADPLLNEVDFPGFGTAGSYDPSHPATAIYFGGGGGNLDYITYAPNMNLAGVGIDPNWLFIVEIKMGELSGWGYNSSTKQYDIPILTPSLTDGKEEIYLTGRFAPPSVPEPATLLLLGMGMVGLAGIGRKFRK